MKKERKTDIIICTTLVVAFLAFLPFLLPACLLELVQLSVDIVAAIATALAVVIAFMAYNKFGIEQRFLEKRFDLVNEFMTAISSVSFSIRSVDKEPAGHFRWIFFSPKYADSFLSGPEKKDAKILIANSYLDVMGKLEGLTSNLLMPKTIAEAVKPLHVEFIGQPYEILLGRYKGKGYYFVNDNSPGAKEEYDLLGFLNGEDMTIEEFATQWRNVLSAIEKWLEENGRIPIELNK